jgi:hypothetical protein
MTRTFAAAVPLWFLVVGAACLWTPASTMWMAILLLGTALLVPPVVLLGSAVVTTLHLNRVASAGRPRLSA